MFDDGFARVDDASEIELLVGSGDKFEMPGSFFDTSLPIGDVERQESIKFFGKTHPQMVADTKLL